jgi:hypothetical protein
MNRPLRQHKRPRYLQDYKMDYEMNNEMDYETDYYDETEVEHNAPKWSPYFNDELLRIPSYPFTSKYNYIDKINNDNTRRLILDKKLT